MKLWVNQVGQEFEAPDASVLAYHDKRQIRLAACNAWQHATCLPIRSLLLHIVLFFMVDSCTCLRHRGLE